MKNVKIVGAGLCLGLSLSMLNAFSIADLAGGQIIKDNSKKNVENCKNFYNKNKIVYKGYNDVDVDARVSEVILKKRKVLNQLREFDMEKNEKLSKFNYKWAEVDKDTNHFYCRVILDEGMPKKEQKAFAQETLEKFDPK